MGAKAHYSRPLRGDGAPRPQRCVAAPLCRRASAILLLLASTLQAEEAGSISGRVLGPDGAGVGLVPVSVISAESKESSQGQSAVDGTYVVTGLQAGSYIVQATGDDQNYLARKKVKVDAGSETKDVDLASGGLVLAGKATDAGGGPVEGAFVTATKTDFREGEFLPTASARTAHTDAQGQFRMEGLLPGSYTIVMAGPGLGIRMLTNFVIDADAQCDVVFENSCFIAGRVLDANGGPLKDAQLQVFRVHPSPMIRCFGMTGDDGLFRIGNLGPGQYEVIAMGPGVKASVTSGVDVASGATHDLGDLALTTGGGTITGHVTYGPLPLPTMVILRSTTSLLEFMTRADEQGVYTFEMIPEGDYHIDFSDPTGKPAPVTVRDGDTVVLDYSYYSP